MTSLKLRCGQVDDLTVADLRIADAVSMWAVRQSMDTAAAVYLALTASLPQQGAAQAAVPVATAPPTMRPGSTVDILA